MKVRDEKHILTFVRKPSREATTWQT